MNTTLQIKKPNNGEVADVALETTESLDKVKSLLYYEKEASKNVFSEPKTQSITQETMISTLSDIDSEKCVVPEPSDCTKAKLVKIPSFSLTENHKEKNTETYFEVYDENEAGLSWGKKVARDQTWQERWLQQQLPEGEESNQTVFGRSSGVNTEFCQRWVASWETKTQGKKVLQKVEKKVQKFDNNNFDNLIEEWNEEVTNETQELHSGLLASELSEGEAWFRRQVVQKRGYDKLSERYWTESSCKTYFHEAGSSNDTAQEITSAELEKKPLEYKEYFYEQFVNTGVQRIKRTKINLDGTVETQTIIEEKDENNQPTVQELEEKEYSLSNGDSVVEKVEKNESGHISSYKIIKHKNDEDLLETCIEKTVTAEENTQQLIRYKHADGRVHCIRTEMFPAKKNKSYEEVKDEWWTKSDGESWGERSIKISKTAQSAPTHQEFEKWYDNLKEKVVDSWAVDTEYDPLNETPVFLKRYGKKEGDRYSDGTKWGEKWSKTFEPGVADENETTAKNDDGSTFLLRIDFYDRWWKEPSGNQWGEKKRLDLKEGTEVNEHWYDNGTEKQVDRWNIDKDGTRHGEKFGEKIHGQCEWKEKWAQSQTCGSSENFYIDKNWQENQDGKCLKWGENQGREGEKQWNTKWRLSKDESSNSGSHWEESWDDDGFGNFQICSKGNEWTDGETVNWYYNKHGECLGKSEKWAIKKGGDSSGNVWMEKWNETPLEKFAEKEGSNTEGDEWHEIWKESVAEDGHVTKWAEKIGKNNKGEEWLESWWEDQHHKQAKKTGRNNSEKWQEEWGEQKNPDGSGEKWTSKWCENLHSGDRRGQNWGDCWGRGGIGGHHWDEKWLNDHKVAYSYEIPSRPEGC